jgi:hypothetical protein
MDSKFNHKWNLGSLDARFANSRFVRRVVLSAAYSPAHLRAGTLPSEICNTYAKRMTRMQRICEGTTRVRTRAYARARLGYEPAYMDGVNENAST